MKAYSWDLKKALNYVQNKRQCIKPNSSFISQLETYQVRHLDISYNNNYYFGYILFDFIQNYQAE